MLNLVILEIGKRIFNLYLKISIIIPHSFLRIAVNIEYTVKPLQGGNRPKAEHF